MHDADGCKYLHDGRHVKYVYSHQQNSSQSNSNFVSNTCSAAIHRDDRRVLGGPSRPFICVINGRVIAVQLDAVCSARRRVMREVHSPACIMHWKRSNRPMIINNLGIAHKQTCCASSSSAKRNTRAMGVRHVCVCVHEKYLKDAWTHREGGRAKEVAKMLRLWCLFALRARVCDDMWWQTFIITVRARHRKILYALCAFWLLCQTHLMRGLSLVRITHQHMHSPSMDYSIHACGHLVMAFCIVYCAAYCPNATSTLYTIALIQHSNAPIGIRCNAVARKQFIAARRQPEYNIYNRQ